MTIESTGQLRHVSRFASALSLCWSCGSVLAVAQDMTAEVGIVMNHLCWGAKLAYFLRAA